MAEFTKGPWTWHTGLDGRVYLGGRHSALVLAVRADSIYVSQEDSRLIAAAPELYDALDRLMNLNHFHLEDCIYEVREAVLSDEDYDGNTWDHPDVTAFSETVEKIKTALAKARGEK